MTTKNKNKNNNNKHSNIQRMNNIPWGEGVNCPSKASYFVPGMGEGPRDDFCEAGSAKWKMPLYFQVVFYLKKKDIILPSQAMS